VHDAWIPLALSLKVAGWATALDIVFGVAVALALARWRSSARDIVDALLTLPLVMPPTVLGYYLLVLLGRRGPIGAWLDTFGVRLVFTWQGAVIAAMIAAFPLVLKSARSAFESVDPQLEQAARTLGMGEAALFFRVTLPLAVRGIVAGALLAFALSIDDYVVTSFVNGQVETFPIWVYGATRIGVPPQVNVMGTLIFLGGVAIAVGNALLARRQRA
jgi:molybdate transport system permease protein